MEKQNQRDRDRGSEPTTKKSLGRKRRVRRENKRQIKQITQEALTQNVGIVFRLL